MMKEQCRDDNDSRYLYFYYFKQLDVYCHEFMEISLKLTGQVISGHLQNCSFHDFAIEIQREIVQYFRQFYKSYSGTCSETYSGVYSSPKAV